MFYVEIYIRYLYNDNLFSFEGGPINYSFDVGISPLDIFSVSSQVRRYKAYGSLVILYSDTDTSFVTHHPHQPTPRRIKSNILNVLRCLFSNKYA